MFWSGDLGPGDATLNTVAYLALEALLFSLVLFVYVVLASLRARWFFLRPVRLAVRASVYFHALALAVIVLLVFRWATRFYNPSLTSYASLVWRGVLENCFFLFLDFAAIALSLAFLRLSATTRFRQNA